MAWSKEYVEHLRAVYYSLIVVATGLVVLALSAKRYDPVRALAELEEILELKSLWSPHSITEFGAFEVSESPECKDFVACKLSSTLITYRITIWSDALR